MDVDAIDSSAHVQSRCGGRSVDGSFEPASVGLNRDMDVQHSSSAVVPVSTEELPIRKPVESSEVEALHGDGEVDVDLGL